MKIGDSTYYCWNCDAHRHIAIERDAVIACPTCGTQLGEEGPVVLAFPTLANHDRFADEHDLVRYAS